MNKKDVDSIGNNNNVRSILVSQPLPDEGLESTPYFKLKEKYNVKVDFRSFIHIEPVSVREFKKQGVDINNFTSVIFTSRKAVDYFFKTWNELSVNIPNDTKYFCISNQTANYLHKYIVIRKRKLFVGNRTAKDLIEVLKKHKTEKFIFPCSNIRKSEIPNFLSESKYQFQEAILYKTVQSDLSDLKNVNYDIIAFFSPSGINSLIKNFPDFKQNKTRIAAFGPTTAKAVKDAGLKMDIKAPHPDAPSMAGALELYIKGLQVKN